MKVVRCVQVKCKHCLWGHNEGVSCNVTRLQDHYVKKHMSRGLPKAAEESESDMMDADADHLSRESMSMSSGSVSGSSSSGPSPAKKARLVQSNLHHYGDRGFQTWQKELAEERLLIWQASFGISHHCLESAEFRGFCGSLRGDFRVPGVRAMRSRRSQIYERLQNRMLHRIEQMRHVALAVDGWDDHQHMATLGCTVLDMAGTTKPMLLLVQQQSQRQVATYRALLNASSALHPELLNFLNQCVGTVESVNSRVVAIVGDNAANLQAAMRGLEHKLVPLSCLSHCAELLVKDLNNVWPTIFGRAELLEQFFRGHYPRACYVQEMERYNSSVLEGEAKLTLLQSACDTRCGAFNMYVICCSPLLIGGVPKSSAWNL